MKTNLKNIAAPMKLDMSLISGGSQPFPFPSLGIEHVDSMDRKPPIATKDQFHSECSASGIYLLKDLPQPMTVSGSANLLAHFGLEATYNKFCGGKKVKETLSSFLPDLPGYIDTVGMQDNSSLNALIERPPTTKEIQPLSQSLLSSFRLHAGPLPAQYKVMYQSIDSTRRKSKHHKKHRSNQPLDAHPNDSEEYEHKKHKKKKHEDSDKRKKKKEKKKKKERDKERN